MFATEYQSTQTQQAPRADSHVVELDQLVDHDGVEEGQEFIMCAGQIKQRDHVQVETEDYPGDQQALVGGSPIDDLTETSEPFGIANQAGFLVFHLVRVSCHRLPRKYSNSLAVEQ